MFSKERIWGNFPFWNTPTVRAIIKIVLLVISILFSACGAKQTLPEPPPCPTFIFTATLHDHQNILDIEGCDIGILENGLREVSIFEEKMLDKLAGLVERHDLQSQSYQWHESIVEHFDILDDEYSEQVEEIFADLVLVLDHNNIDHPDFKVFLVAPQSGGTFANAWITGSYVYITKDLLTLLNFDESMICSVLAHEVGHFIGGDAGQAVQRQFLAEKYFGSWSDTVLKLYNQSIGISGQSEELVADLLSVILMEQTHRYDPMVAVEAHQLISSGRHRNAFKKLLSSHPTGEVRMNCLAGSLTRAKIKARNFCESRENE